MNQAKAAAALNTIAVAFGELAEALQEGTGTPVAPPTPAKAMTSAGPAQEVSPFIDIPDEAFAAPQGSLAMCPKHHVPYTPGQYGDFCKEITNDPAWGKQKGDRLWCRITPKNAADWLRINAA